MRMLFRLITGSYRVKDAVYRKGETVESSRNLVKVFPNRFVMLRDDPEPDRPNIPTKKHSLSTTEEEDGEQSSSSVLSSEEKKGKKGKKEKKAKKDVIDESWDDMTEEFEQAIAEDLKVYYDGESYKVVNPKFNRILNKKNLPALKDVTSFLKKHLAV